LLIIFNTLYRRSEQSACFGFLFLSNGLSAIVGSASAVGIASMGTQYNIHAWQWFVINVSLYLLRFYLLTSDNILGATSFGELSQLVSG
jgi:hypothetical protein